MLGERARSPPAPRCGGQPGHAVLRRISVEPPHSELLGPGRYGDSNTWRDAEPRPSPDRCANTASIPEPFVPPPTPGPRPARLVGLPRRVLTSFCPALRAPLRSTGWRTPIPSAPAGSSCSSVVGASEWGPSAARKSANHAVSAPFGGEAEAWPPPWPVGPASRSTYPCPPGVGPHPGLVDPCEVHRELAARALLRKCGRGSSSRRSASGTPRRHGGAASTPWPGGPAIIGRAGDRLVSTRWGRWPPGWPRGPRGPRSSLPTRAATFQPRRDLPAPACCATRGWRARCRRGRPHAPGTRGPR